MIGRIQNHTAFKGVYIKRDGETKKNIKIAYNDLVSEDNDDKIFPISELIKTDFRATLRYGMEQLNDRRLEDGVTRYLTFDPLYDENDGSLSGYNLGIVEEDGRVIASSICYQEGASVLTLKRAFDDLKESYKGAMASSIAEQYTQIHTLDNIVDCYTKNSGPYNA